MMCETLMLLVSVEPVGGPSGRVPLGTLDVEALEGLVEVVGERIVLTRRGRLLGNEVSLRLTP